MSTIRIEAVNSALNRAFSLTDYNIYNDIHKRFEFKRRTVLSDNSLTKDEKIEAIRRINNHYDRDKVTYNKGIGRICENCNQECLATLYCEYCVRNYLKKKFSSWTSGNNDIDNLIQSCQMEALLPDRIVEWIPYSNLQNIKYLTRGGCSEIYTAVWINGRYDVWNSKEQQLTRVGIYNVILKRLENVESANKRWFEEAKSHLTISNKWTCIVQCFGLTQDPSNGNYMLVMNRMNIDLRTYLQQYHNQLTWKKRILIIVYIVKALEKVHYENAIHRDLHSGNVLYSQLSQQFKISDFGFCGPADKSLKSVYGNLPYIAPEVIAEKEYTFKSDIYSIAMLMWEVSSGKPPFTNYEHDYNLAMNIINGMRPKIILGTPLEYKNLMEQCWDADPTKRPDVYTLFNKINKINLHYQDKCDEQQINLNIKNLQLNTNFSVSSNFSSKIYNFKDMPKSKNATSKKAYHSIQLYLSIPDTIIDEQEGFTNKRSKSNNNEEAYNGVEFQYRQRSYHNNNNINEEIYNNPNLHSKEQDELEISDGGEFFFKYC